MIIVIIVAVSVGLLAYAALTSIEERVTARRRLAFAMGEKVNAPTSVAFNREKLIQKIEQEQRGRMEKRPPLSLLLVRAGFDLSEKKIKFAIGVLAIIAGGLSYLTFGSILIGGLVSFFCIFVVPRLVLSILISRREAAFLDNFPDALDVISRGLKAGMPLTSCLKQIAETSAEPIRSEFSYVLDLQKIGVPIADAIKKMPERMDLLDLRIFTIVIEIQQKSGGNLAEIIENISGVIRGRKEIRAKIRALIAEAKVSAIIIGVMPLGFAALSYYSDAEGFSKFWTEPIGQVLLGVSITLYLVGTGLFIFLAKPK